MQAPRAHIGLRLGLLGFFRALSRLAIRKPRRVLLVSVLVMLAAAPGIVRLKLRTDGNALIPPDAPAVTYDRAIRGRFGVEDNLVVLIRSGDPEGIFNPKTLNLVRELTAEFTKLPGIQATSIMSLATEPTFRMRPGTLVNQRVLEPPLTTKAELDQLREDLRRIELYTGTLVSADGRATAILIGVPAEADRPALYRRVMEVIASRGAVSDGIAVTGAPVAESLLGIHILEDLGVPKALLGASTHGRGAQEKWKLPTSLYELRRLIARRVGLVPVAALVMMLVLWATFRNVPAALVPLPGVAATLVFVFGLMGWCGMPIYLTIAVMPVLLTAIGVTNDIYLFNRYFTLLREQPDAGPAELLGETFEKLAVPVAGTSLTSAIGFLSFGFSPLMPVRAFGLMTGIGVLFGLIYSLTVVPAMLVLLNPAWFVSGRSRRGNEALTGSSNRRADGASLPRLLLIERTAAGFARLGNEIVRLRWGVVSLALLVAALIPLGLRRLTVQDSWTDAFDPDSEFSRATHLVNREFYGMHILHVAMEVPRTLTGSVPASALSPNSLLLAGDQVADPTLVMGNSIAFSLAGDSLTNPATAGPGRADWSAHIEMGGRSGTNSVFRLAASPAQNDFWKHLASIGQAQFAVPVRTQLQPETIREAGDLAAFLRQHRQEAVGGVIGPYEYLTTTRFMVRPNDPNARRLPESAGEIKLMWDFYGLARGPHHLREVVDTNYWTTLTTVFLKDANFISTARLLRALRDYEREHLAPRGIHLGFAGDVAVSQSLIAGIVATQLRSLLWSLVGIFVVTTLLGGSLRWGAYCLLPSLLAVLVKFAIMGWVGIPLGVATSMFAAMTLGIGVNCAIHLLEGCHQAQAAGLTPTAALSRSVALTGPPALINTVAVSLGFGVLILSQVPANARLGILLVVGLVNCLLASLAILPVLLNWWPLRGPRT
jgi:predicted RND superfamily exporter protein